MPMRRVGLIQVAAVTLLLFGPCIHPPRVQATDERSRTRGGALNVVVLSTMLADTKGVGEWGFSALVEADGHRLLFDTGARPETVLRNVRELGIDLAGVTDVVLSHHHGD